MTPESYEDAVAGMLDLATTWDALAFRCGDATPKFSQCAVEAKALPTSIEVPVQLTRAIAGDAVSYVSAASQHLRALATLLGPEIVLTGWSVIRATAEYCGRVNWLLNPGATPTDRVARFYMERIVSIHMTRMATDKIGQKQASKQYKQKRQQVLNEARQVFRDITLFDNDGPNGWVVGDQPYASLSSAVNTFGKEQLNADGLYDMLSGFTHPSLIRLGAQTTTVRLEDRLHHAFVADPGVLRWQFALACACVYRAAHLVTSYLGMDATPLEEWADHHSALLSWSSHASNGT
ncbi:hypothetical protein AAIH25_14960 [Arthrobacter crystallopoietes]|uniref:hypothetical protein n=1 Tax=Crystallibacter crystallopoietes TaxID=37928 RepID=UPI003D1BDD52